MSIVNKKKYFTNSPQGTKKIGESLAKEILKHALKNKAILIALEGELGSGKTTFLQGFAKGLGVKEKILSPTFILMRRFKISTSRHLEISKSRYFYHIDCYRIEGPEELVKLGFKELVSDPRNIICIEWADKVKKNLPKSTWWLRFRFQNKNKRRINLDKYLRCLTPGVKHRVKHRRSQRCLVRLKSVHTNQFAQT